MAQAVIIDVAIAAVLLLPLIWELDGIWYSILVAESMAVAFTALFLLLKRHRFAD